MVGPIPLIHGSDGELNDALAAAVGVPRSLHAAGYTSAGRPRTNWGDVPCSLQPPGTVEYIPPQPEGTPAMNPTEPCEEAPKDSGTLPAMLSELEELISELNTEMQCLENSVERLAGTEPKECSDDSKAEAVPGTHIARLHHHLIHLRMQRDYARELNRRLAEVV